MRKRGKTLKHGHREKEEGESHAKGEEEQMRGKTPLRAKRAKESAQKCNRTRSEPADSSF